jgi:hypothetical protein
MALSSSVPDDWELRLLDVDSLHCSTNTTPLQHGDDRPSPEEPPARLSALYQYHNAPEVAPAHGLEYDDTIYPHSDKFPVIKETIFSRHHYTGKHAYENDNRPPRIIFGMKVKTFLVVATIMVLVIVGAAVGGAVGGKNLHQEPGPEGTLSNMDGYVDTLTSNTNLPVHMLTIMTARNHRPPRHQRQRSQQQQEQAMQPSPRQHQHTLH